MPGGVYTEENGIYQLDCSNALWATDQIHGVYHAAKVPLCDADFVIETDEMIYIVEYKNANIPNAANPGAFRPSDPPKLDNVARKFFDTLHYLALIQKNKPITYIYIVEYLNASETDRKFLRNKLVEKLPFQLQQGMPKTLIHDMNVVSIAEWNAHSEYAKYPLTQVQQGAATV